MARTRPADENARRGRLAKAVQFFDVAADVTDLADDDRDSGDAYVTLLVHSGIASADAICCARLGEYSSGENHQEAAGLLSKAAGTVMANNLRTLLGLKTKAGYSHTPMTQTDRKRALRAATELLAAANQ